MSITLEDITSGYNLSIINSNFQTLESYINSQLLARAGAVAGEAKMSRDLDMDGNRILNADLDGSTITNDRAIRVAEFIPPIAQSAEERKGKVVSFDINTGNPTAIAPSSGSALDVLNQLALPTGSTLVGNGVGNTVASSFTNMQNYVNGKFARDVHLDDYPNIVGDGVHNDAPGIQAAILDVAIKGGGRIRGSFGKQYYIPATILIPTDIVIDLNQATLVGERVTTTVPMFETAYLQAGALLSNISSPDETQLVWNTVFCNGYVKDAYQFLNAKNFIKGSGIFNVAFSNCRQIIIGNRCFYSSYINLEARGGSSNSVPMLQFVGQNNAIYFERVTTTVGFGYQFTGGTTAVKFNQCTFEGGVVGFDMQGDCYGVHWDSCYFEAVQGTLFRFLNAGTCQVKFTSNYVNLVDVVIQGGGLPTSYLFGIWDKTNAIVRVGETVGGFTYRGIVGLDNNHDYLDFHIREDVNNNVPDLPSNYHFALASSYQRIVSLEGTGAGNVVAKNISSGGVVPRHYSGNPGQTVSNVVPFASHNIFVPDTYANCYVRVATKINFSDLMRGSYKITITTGAGTSVLYGDIYGNIVKRADGTTVGTVIENDGSGYTRLVFGPLNAPSGTYTCTGFVQLM